MRELTFVKQVYIHFLWGEGIPALSHSIRAKPILWGQTLPRSKVDGVVAKVDRFVAEYATPEYRPGWSMQRKWDKISTLGEIRAGFELVTCGAPKARYPFQPSGVVPLKRHRCMSLPDFQVKFSTWPELRCHFHRDRLDAPFREVVWVDRFGKSQMTYEWPALSQSIWAHSFGDPGLVSAQMLGDLYRTSSTPTRG